MEDPYIKKIITAAILVILLVLSFFLLRPILLSIILGFILAFAFNPVYNLLLKITKSQGLSSFLICFLLIVVMVLPIWFLTPVLVDQSVRLYLAVQQIDFIEAVQTILPLLTSEEFSVEFGYVIQSFVTKSINSLMHSLSEIVISFPTLLLQFLVTFFTFFFVLKDQDKIIHYGRSLLPFSKDVEGKLFKSSKQIISSVINGQIIIGIIQGLFTGIGFFIFGAPNALLLTFLAALTGIFPIVGPFIVWVPVAIYLFVSGNTFAAFGLALFGLFASTIDNFLRPLLVSKRAKLHPALVMIGMIGGFFFLGVLGLILGPLILAYLLIMLEIYRNKKVPGVLIQEPIK
jgi:predicted PurR-regulated permease PerM